MSKKTTPQEEARRKTELSRMKRLASFLGCKPKEIEIWEQMEIENEGIATYILSYDSVRLAITDIGESPSLHPIYWNSPVFNRLKGRLGLDTKDQFIAMYGIEAYKKQRVQIKVSHAVKAEKEQRRKDWTDAQEHSRKGGKYYLKHLEDKRTGLQAKGERIMSKCRRIWGRYKRIIAPDSRLSYLWVQESAKCKCVAVVETVQRMHEFKDVIKIEAGKTPILTTEELQAGVNEWE